MSSHTGRATMDGYLDALLERGDFGRYFSDDVRLELIGTPEAADGREAVEQMIRFLHEDAFDARAELKGAFAAGDRAALEADFVGTHTGEFGGVAPSGNQVRVPYSVFYDLRGAEITALRIYMPMDLLMRQISGAAASTTATA
jgi:predicted ester cyclase